MSLRIAYLTLEAPSGPGTERVPVPDVVNGLRELGHRVEVFSEDPKQLVRTLGNFDALYVRSHPHAFDAERAAAHWGKAVIVECGGTYDDVLESGLLQRPLRSRLIRRLRQQYRDADALIATSPQLATWLASETGRTDVETIPGGANTGLFTPDAPLPDGLPERYAVFVGELAPWQGISTCLDAVSTESWPRRLSLVIAGDGAALDEVQNAAENDPRIFYVGPVPYRTIPGIVAGSVCALLTERGTEHEDRELAPLRLFESMACGVPVIVSRVGGMDAMVSRWGCGVSFPPGDATALARAVAEISIDPDAAHIMGNAGRAAVLREASWLIRAEQTALVIERAVAKLREARRERRRR